MLKVQQERYNYYDQSNIIVAMRKEAAQRGCDGLVILGNANAVVGSGSTDEGNGMSSTRTLEGLRASCVVFTASSSQQAAAHPRSACVPGATQPCTGPGGCKGGQACKQDGSGFEACDCGQAAAADPEAN